MRIRLSPLASDSGLWGLSNLKKAIIDATFSFS